jgi:glycosyltransferase involved in cell wall biosynthesis
LTTSRHISRRPPQHGLKILICGGVSQSLVNFRGPLIRAFRERGHSVWACAGEPRPEVREALQRWGVPFHPIPLARTGTSPLDDLRTWLALKRLITSIGPDIVFAYTIKPVIWGGLAARTCRTTKVYALITGLGYAFQRSGDFRSRLIGMIARRLYRTSLKTSTRVFCQNPDDMATLIRMRLIREEQGILVNGSGVDLQHFATPPLPSGNRFLMMCRLLVDKGVREYAHAADALRRHHGALTFSLAGELDPNPASIAQHELDQWIQGGTIHYLGQLDDVRPALRDASVYVLPSYYPEGTPRTILEAMSMGRPIVTTDAPGCRETVPLTPKGQKQCDSGESVMEGENGFLVRVRDAQAVAEAMQKFIDHPELIPSMGKRSREIAIERYDVHKVNAAMMDVMGL